MATVSSPPRNLDSNKQRIRHPLQSLRGYIRRYVFLEGTAVALIFLAAMFWIGLFLDFGLFFLPRDIFFIGWFDWIKEIDRGLSYSDSMIIRGVLLAILAIGFWVVVATKVFGRLLGEFSDRSLALVLERRYTKLLGDRLITAVEMADRREAEKMGYSQEMVDHTIQAAAERVQRCPVRDVFDWGRLYRQWFLVALLTIGMYAATFGGYAVYAAFTDKPLTDFFWGFNRTAAVFIQRDVLLQDRMYWPTSAYVEIVRFQESPESPGEMRVPRDGKRPKVKAQAFQWVLFDPSVPDGVRPLRFSDLGDWVEPDVLNIDLPDTWDHWLVDADDLDPEISTGSSTPDWHNKPISNLKKIMEMGGFKSNNKEYKDAFRKLITWKTWTLDQISLQVKDKDIRRKLKEEKVLGQFDLLFAKLDELAESPLTNWYIRKLDVPERVNFSFRGEQTKKNHSAQSQDGKYIFPLTDINEDVTFYVRADNFYTPSKKIAIIPPPSLINLEIELAQPAYLHYYLDGKQQPLKNKKHVFPFVNASLSAGSVTTIQVPVGSDLRMIAKANRKLKPIVFMKAPKKPLVRKDAPKGPFPLNLIQEEDVWKETSNYWENMLRDPIHEEVMLRNPTIADKAREKIASRNLDEEELAVEQKKQERRLVKKYLDSLQPDELAELKSDVWQEFGAGRFFGFQILDVQEPMEWVFHFYDRDGVKGSRHIIVEPVDDRPPLEVANIELDAILRKPRLQATGMEAARLDGYLITPVALLPFKGIVKDDHGLVHMEWKYKYEKVDFELMESNESEPKKLTPSQSDKDRVRRAALVAYGFHVVPNSLSQSVMASLTWGLVSDRVRQDIKAVAEKTKSQSVVGFIPMELFAAKMAGIKDKALNPKTFKNLLINLRGKNPPDPLLLKSYQINREEFDVGKYFDFASINPKVVAQNHYRLQLEVVATDNNIDEPNLENRKLYSKLPITFLVVSEGELLSQILLEEEEIRNRIERVVGKLRDGKVRLDKQIQDMQSSVLPDPAVVQLQSNKVRRDVQDGSTICLEAYDQFTRIREEMRINRVNKDRIKKVNEKICIPLRTITRSLPEVDKGSVGNFIETDQKLEALFNGLTPFADQYSQAQKAQKGEATLFAIAQENKTKNYETLVQSRKELAMLIADLDNILDEMGGVILYDQLVASLVELERDQRRSVNDELQRLEAELIRRLFQDLIAPEE